MELNSAQKQAVESEAAMKAVIAGPGSGKTRTLVECIKRRAGSSVMVVFTFTNGAAHELRKRIGDVEPAFVGTRHSYCFRLIQRHGHLIGYKSGSVGILPAREQVPRLLAVRDMLGSKLSQKKLLGAHTVLADQAEQVDKVRIWKEYRFVLKQNNLVDYDAILADASHLLHRPEVLDAIKIDDLFVDEKQDDSSIDWLIDSLIPATNKFYVGDPDQSIYAFRGSYPMGLVRWAEMPGVETIRLEVNYRSDKAICRAADSLIAHNTQRIEKYILPVSEAEGLVQVQNFEDGWEEAEFIASNVAMHRHRNETVAVLLRMNAEAQSYSQLLFGRGITVETQRRQDRPPDWERALLLLSILFTPENDILVERYLKLDHDEKVVDRWRLEAQAGGKKILEKVGDLIADATIWKAQRFLHYHGVGEETVRLIKSRADLLPPDGGLGDLLQDLYSHEEWTRDQSATDGVFVGTMHAAKGREWDVVFLPAFEQGVCPMHEKGEFPAAIVEEERRLAFVAITRARHFLYLTTATVRANRWAGQVSYPPSQFIKEALREPSKDDLSLDTDRACR